MPELRTALLDLLYETRDDDLKLIIGGGYGLFLKREHLLATEERTLLKEWPQARSTNDLDLFLRPELLIDPSRLKPLAVALPRLGYDAVPGAEKYQFLRPGPSGDKQGELKIDLLTGPRSSFKGTKVKVDARRARPQPSIDLHAHPTDEAITLEEGLSAITITGTTSAGIEYSGEIYLPHPFTFALMKLFAYRDRKDDEDKEYGRYHALDIYSIIAMMTESELVESQKFSKLHAQSPIMRDACGIVKEYFSAPTAEGVLRLQESPYYRKSMQLDEFCDAIKTLFPSTEGPNHE